MFKVSLVCGERCTLEEIHSVVHHKYIKRKPSSAPRVCAGSSRVCRIGPVYSTVGFEMDVHQVFGTHSTHSMPRIPTKSLLWPKIIQLTASVDSRDVQQIQTGW